MSQPGQRPSSGETPPVSPQDLREYNGIVLPLSYLGNQTFMQSALARSTPANMDLHERAAIELFPPSGGEYAAAVAESDFGRLRALAENTATVLTEGRELTVPGAFGIHVVASVYAARRLPPIPGADDRESYFLTNHASRLAWRTPVEAIERGPDPFAFFQAIGERTMRLAEKITGNSAWLRSKLHLLTDRLIMRNHITKTIEAEPSAEVEDIQHLEEMNTQLFGELQRLGRFSIQSGAHTEGGMTWSIHDMSDYYMQLAAALERADGTVRPDRWQPQMIMQATEREDDGREVIVGQFLATTGQARPNYDAFNRQVYMGNDGNLYADMHGTVPLRPLYEAAGKPVNYEVLRQFLMEKYFDLTMPATLVEMARVQTSQMLRTEDPGRDRREGTVYPDLLLPRIRMLRSFANADELERADGTEI